MTAHRLLVMVGVVMIGAFASAAPAPAGSEKPAALLVFPRVQVDTAQGIDTLVQISNASTSSVGVLCFYVNALGSCGGTGDDVCATNADCPPGVGCTDQCAEVDFIFTLSPRQTLGFAAEQGLMPPMIDLPPGLILQTPTDPFYGELKCLTIDPVTNAPVARNSLIGTATIMRTTGPDAASYSAIGIESTGRNDGDGTLCLGSNATGDCPVAEYVRCPHTLNLEHFFEGAILDGAEIENELTLVPCSQTLIPPEPVTHQIEVTVINEFEERRCGTLSVRCVSAIAFADLPLMSVGLQGTLAGHTRLRALPGGEDDIGHAVLGIALERHVPTLGTARSAAHQLRSEGASEQADFVRFEVPPPFRRIAGAGATDKTSVRRTRFSLQRSR